MLVYRVEDDYNEGPYRCSRRYMVENEKLEAFSSKLNNSHTNYEHPGRFQDFASFLEFKSSFLFGFSSIQDLKDWFKGFRSALRKFDFKMAIYDAEEVHTGISGSQVVFDVYTAKLVKKIRIP